MKTLDNSQEERVLWPVFLTPVIQKDTIITTMDIQRIEKKEKEQRGSFSDIMGLEKEISNSFEGKDEYVSGIEKKKRKWTKNLLVFILIIFSMFLAWSAFFSWKVHSVGKKMTIENENSSYLQDAASLISSVIPSKRVLLRGEENGRINILLLGAAGEGKAGRNLTDTIMMMSINTEKKKVALLSLPRDLYVNIPDTKIYAKINSLYQYGLNNDEGIEPLKKTVQEITGQDINYFAVLNYEGFEKIVDDIGGINIEAKRDVYDSRYPGPNYSYETFELEKGFHLLDGKTALKYVRYRHGDPEGDFGRAKRQQQVIQSTKNRTFSLGTFLNVFTLNNLLNDLGESIKTDIPISDIDSFIAISKEVDTENMTNVVVDAWKKDSLLKVSHVWFGDIRAFMLVPRVGNYSEIQELAENIFELEKVQERKEKIEEENASIAIINRSEEYSLSQKISSLLNEKLELDAVPLKSSGDYPAQEKTVVIDQTGGRKLFSLDEIVTKLPAELSDHNNGIIKSEADFILFLGKDLVDKYDYEENSIDDLNNAEMDQQYLELIKEN